MAQTTYRKLSEIILNQHYGAMPTPTVGITIKHIAEIVAMKVAKFAKMNAFGNSNDGEFSFSDDQFISVYYNLPLLTNEVTLAKYFVIPATPTSLPANREIVQVSLVGCPDTHIIPMKNKDDFTESLLPPLPNCMVLYKIEDGKIVFKYLPPLVYANADAAANVKLVGAISGPTLLDSVLNIPKDVEDQIMQDTLLELNPNYNIKQQNIDSREPS